jgi:hypothetical protein
MTRRGVKESQQESLLLCQQRSLAKHRANTVSMRDIGAKVVVTTLVVVGHAILSEV